MKNGSARLRVLPLMLFLATFLSCAQTKTATRLLWTVLGIKQPQTGTVFRLMSYSGFIVLPDGLPVAMIPPAWMGEPADAAYGIVPSKLQRILIHYLILRLRTTTFPNP